MTFSVSAGVYTKEQDASAIIPLTLGTIAGFAGQFKWGPAGIAQAVSSEPTLATVFGKPADATTGIDYLTAASYLAYSSNFLVSRIYSSSSRNAVAMKQGATLVAAHTVSVPNDGVFADTTIAATIHIVARYIGANANGLTVYMVDTSTQYDDASFDDYRNLFTSAPDTSTYVSDRGGSLDELHVVVVDTLGVFSGTPGQVLESYGFLSKAIDAKNDSGTSNYYRDVINSRSTYIYIANVDGTAGGLGAEVGSTIVVAGAAFTASTATTAITYTIGTSANYYGIDGTIADADKQAGYDVFSNAEEVDVSLLIGGTADNDLSNYIIENIAEVRKDCVVFVSPPQADVVNQTNFDTVATTVAAYRTATGTHASDGLNANSSYGFLDSGWKYMYDKYNDTNRWIPLNGDIAGLCARTDRDRDPWWSPAGLNRGQIKNDVKLAWNPNESQRDTLYKVGVNPVVKLSGRGTVLYGDKTLLSKPSSFDRINVRRLFIVLEKLIANAAQYSLFEFNDEFTRAQFVALVEPLLREVKGRRGITDFRVVCDTTNNTGQVTASNQFKAKILCRPAYSVNFIELTFTSVGPNVSFEEVAGVSS